MIKMTDTLIDRISNQAKASGRKRSNHNFHKSYSDSIQRFLNAAEPDSYVRPHKHENPDKTEIFILLRGKVLIIEFEDNGTIRDHMILDFEKGNRGVEIAPKTWHSFIALQEGSVLYEVKEGPFIEETGKIFAEWSPEEGMKGAHEFNKKILRELKVCLPET